jgi:hypothetical protein
MTFPTRLVTLFLLVTFMFPVAGCLSVMSEERVGDSVQSVHPLNEQPIGIPRMVVTTHDDGLGWTVSAETRMERTVEYRAVQQWRGRRYVLSPLSVVPGLIQCPMGLLHLFSNNPDNNSFRFGCARLALFEPLDGVTFLPPTNLSTVETNTAWEGLQHGIIQLEWLGRRHHPVSYAVADRGTDVRLSDLLSRLRLVDVPLHDFQHHPVAIRLRYGDGALVEQNVTVSPSQFERALRSLGGPIASDQWPADMVVQVRIESDGISSDERELVRDHLVGLMLDRRMCVMTEGLHSHVLDEQRLQYSGVVDERTQVRLGRLLSPSIMLTASINRSGTVADQTRHMVIQIRDVREGQVLGTAHGRSRSEGIADLVQRTVTDLDLLMAKAPRAGCPR